MPAPTRVDEVMSEVVCLLLEQEAQRLYPHDLYAQSCHILGFDPLSARQKQAVQQLVIDETMVMKPEDMLQDEKAGLQ